MPPKIVILSRRNQDVSSILDIQVVPPKIVILTPSVARGKDPSAASLTVTAASFF
jgi:hypothetical protein